VQQDVRIPAVPAKLAGDAVDAVDLGSVKTTVRALVEHCAVDVRASAHAFDADNEVGSHELPIAPHLAAEHCAAEVVIVEGTPTLSRKAVGEGGGALFAPAPAPVGTNIAPGPAEGSDDGWRCFEREVRCLNGLQAPGKCY